MKIWKPEEADLQSAIDEARKSGTWVDAYLNGVTTLLRKDPLRYRSFGPYWWLVKKALIDRDIYDFGTEIDREWFEDLDYGDEEKNVTAAYLYDESREGLNIYDDSHLLEQEDGEPYEYLANDSDVESMVAR